MSVLISFTSGNSDNTTEAVHGLDIFTKNWCMMAIIQMNMSGIFSTNYLN